jgi:hypothetical protein
MPDKALIVVMSGPEDVVRAEKGMTFALKSKKLGILEDVKVFFWGNGVGCLKPEEPRTAHLQGVLEELKKEGITVCACVTDIKKNNLEALIGTEKVKAAGAAVYISDHIRDGYQVLTF